MLTATLNNRLTPNNGANGDATNHDDEGGPKWTDVVVALAAAATAYFGYALWRSTDKLWIATKRLVEGTERQNSATLRPILKIRQITISQFSPNVKAVFHYMVVNVGHRPATIIEYNQTAVYSKGNVPCGPLLNEPSGLKRGVDRLEAGEFGELWFENEDTKHPDDIEAVKGGDKILFLYGYIAYRDDLQITRRTGFLRRYDHETRRFVPLDEPEYEYQD